jgi:AraC-like DNA-binding protein
MSYESKNLPWLDWFDGSRWQTDRLAGAFGISTELFNEWSQCLFRRPLTVWLRQVRLWTGARMLCQGRSVNETSRRLGYEGAEDFCADLGEVYPRLCPLAFAGRNHPCAACHGRREREVRATNAHPAHWEGSTCQLVDDVRAMRTLMAWRG